MKALIFNSGIGSRLVPFTVDSPKCMVRLSSGETVFHRQLRILSSCGIDEFVVTTGPFAEQLEAEAAPFREAGCAIDFVANPRYEQTNYIYSMWLARAALYGGDTLVLHGDLVFDAAYAQAVIDSSIPSLGSVNASLALPEKDFRARVVNGEVHKVSVHLSGEDCVAFQPFYKLSARAMATWLDSVGRYISSGKVSVYAEDAANEVFDRMGVVAFSYEGHLVEEIDTPDDLERVSERIRRFDFDQQPTFRVHGSSVSLVSGSPIGKLSEAADIATALSALGVRRPLVVATKHFRSLGLARLLARAGVHYELFMGFSPNPDLRDVARGLSAYRNARCDSLLSVGGGSAIDVAKCIKQMLAMPRGADGADLSSGRLPYSGVPHVAVPTTAGTGSESTHFAVCYVGGEKVSVANDCLLPDVALLDPSNLAGLPDYQRKCTMLDALCQAIESHWSLRSCERSRAYTSEAIPLIMGNADAYLAGDPDAAWGVMRAANLAGKAINLTTTTAPHAMSYKLTSMYGIPHGHAVALCMPHCWRELLDTCIRADCHELVTDADATWLRLKEISGLMCTGQVNGCSDPVEGFMAFEEFVCKLGLENSWRDKVRFGDVAVLANSVNAARLSNFPIKLDEQALHRMYRDICR